MMDSNFNNFAQNSDKRALLDLETSKAELLAKYNKMQLKAAGVEAWYFKEFGNIVGLNSKNSKFSDFDSIQKLTDSKLKINIPINNLVRINYNQMAEFLEITSDFLESLDDNSEQNINEQLSLCNSLNDSYNKTDRFGFHFSDFEKDKKIYDSLVPTLTSPAVISAIHAANSYQSSKEKSINQSSKIHTENFDSKNFDSNENSIPFEDISEVVFETPNGQFQVGFNQNSELLAKRKLSNNSFEDVNLQYLEDEDKLVVTSNNLFRRYVFTDFKYSFNKSASLNSPEKLANTINFPSLNSLIFVSEGNNLQVGYDSKDKLIGLEKNNDGTYSELALNYLENTDCLVIKSYNSLNKLKSIKINYITRMLNDGLKNTNQFKSISIDSEKSDNFPIIDSLIYKGPNGIYQVGFDKNNNFVAQLGNYDNFQELEINYIQEENRLILTNPNDGKRYMVNDFQNKVEKFEEDRLYNLQEDYIDFSLSRLEKNLSFINQNSDEKLMRNIELKFYKKILPVSETELPLDDKTEVEIAEDIDNVEFNIENKNNNIEDVPLPIEENLGELNEEVKTTNSINKPILKQKTRETVEDVIVENKLNEATNQPETPIIQSLNNLLTNKNQDSSIITNKVNGQNKLDKFKSKLNNI